MFYLEQMKDTEGEWNTRIASGKAIVLATAMAMAR